MTYLWQKEDFSPEELFLIHQSPKTMNLEALTALGLFYAYGRFNYPRSSDEATLILNKAMAKKHAQAFFVYAHLVAQDFFKGKKDDSKSVAYLKKSAELGFDLAMSKLGDYYLEGRGLKKSYREAERWLVKARNAASIPGLEKLILHYQTEGIQEKVTELKTLLDRFVNIKPYSI